MKLHLEASLSRHFPCVSVGADEGPESQPHGMGSADDPLGLVRSRNREEANRLGYWGQDPSRIRRGNAAVPLGVVEATKSVAVGATSHLEHRCHNSPAAMPSGEVDLKPASRAHGPMETTGPMRVEAGMDSSEDAEGGARVFSLGSDRQDRRDHRYRVR